jgi:hypothetical protein
MSFLCENLCQSVLKEVTTLGKLAISPLLNVSAQETAVRVSGGREALDSSSVATAQQAKG